MQRRRFVLGAAVLAATLAAGCTTTPPTPAGTEARKQEIDAGAVATLDRLYQIAPGARELSRKAAGVLVFPNILSAALIAGGQHGTGVLRIGGRPVDYYSISGASFGWQLGAQSRALVMYFMTDEALRQFRSSSGFTAGINATVALARVGADGSLDTNTIREPIIAFALTNQGLMAGLSIEGTKFTRLDW